MENYCFSILISILILPSSHVYLISTQMTLLSPPMSLTFNFDFANFFDHILVLINNKKIFCFCNLKHHILRGKAMPGKDGDAGRGKIIKVGTSHVTSFGLYH